MNEPVEHQGFWWRKSGDLIEWAEEREGPWDAWDPDDSVVRPPSSWAPPREQGFLSKVWTRYRALPGWVQVAIVVVLLIAGLTSSGEEEPTPTATEETQETDEPTPGAAELRSRVTDFQALNPAALQVFIITRNTGDAPGEASCTVRASDPSGSYSGFDLFDVGEIGPGDLQRWNGTITIENEGAAFVTDVTVDC
jgi:hypothetical protein